MNHITPLSDISHYLERYYLARKKGLDEWQLFWDYKCSILGAGDTMFDDEYLLETSRRLLCYLVFYGMALPGTHLHDASCSERFSSVLLIFRRQETLQMMNTAFDQVDWSANPFAKIWDDLRCALNDIDVRPTDTMRSKILMAIWGQIPAWDSRFKRVFRATWDLPRVPSFPVRALNLLREKYQQAWQKEIADAPEEWKETIRGNPIPDARLLDIAFWFHGEGKFAGENDP